MRKNGWKYFWKNWSLFQLFSCSNFLYRTSLHLLNKYRNTILQSMKHSEGTAFIQGGRYHRGGRGRVNRGGRSNKPFNKEYWKDKECFNCNKEGYPSTSFPEEEKDSGKAFSSSWSGKSKIVTNITKYFKKMKNILHRYSSYKSHNPTFMMTTMMKKICTFRLQTGDSNLHY